MVEPSNMSILHAVFVFFISYLFFKAVILCKSNNFYYGARKKSRKILEHLNKSPRKGTAT